MSSQAEAQQNCVQQTEEKKCWVCVNGTVAQLTEAQAKARGLKCYSSQREASVNCGQGPKPATVSYTGAPAS